MTNLSTSKLLTHLIVYRTLLCAPQVDCALGCFSNGGHRAVSSGPPMRSPVTFPGERQGLRQSFHRWDGSGGNGFGMIQCITFIMYFISVIMTSAPPQIIRH